MGEARRVTYFGDSIPKSKVIEIKTELGLDGFVEHYDRFIAAYHVYQPDKVGTPNYQELIERRNKFLQFIRDKTTDLTVSPKKVPQRQAPSSTKKTFEDRCEEILVDFENGDFSQLSSLTSRQIKYMRERIMSYYESVDELKELDPINYKIYQLLGKEVSKVQNVREKQRVKRHIERIQVCEEYGGLRGRPPSEFYTDKKYLLLFNVKYRKAYLCELGAVNERWKGEKTFKAKMEVITVPQKSITDLFALRTSKQVLSFFKSTGRKIEELDALRINEQILIVKSMGR